MTTDDGEAAADGGPDGRPRAVIPYEAVSTVDLSALDGLDDAGLRAHFEGVAAEATVPQLRLFLDGQTFSGLGDETHAQLSERYVARRMGVVRDLLDGRARMNRTLDDLLGTAL